MKTDIEIAQSVQYENIYNISHQLGLNDQDIEPYGHYKAKVSLEALANKKGNKKGNLILVTAINPTASGEGKSTISIGLADALSNQLNEKTMLSLREPSLGPVMGVKGGATGGGYSQVVPMEDINLHFTGDIHAITTANNTLSAIIDNHIHQGNELKIDINRILWKRVVDLNDRALRNVIVGLGGKKNGVPREDGFDITVASEIMAVLCLATSIKDLKDRLSKIVVAYSLDNQPITVKDLGVEGVLTVLLKDAIKPNLVQTLEKTPTFIHGGPFANIAHGCSSVISINAALQLADYVVTEAGFGSDLGGEKFLDIVSHSLDTKPSAIVIVATTKALKLNAGIEKNNLNQVNIKAVEEGFSNLEKHILNMQKYKVPVVVAINKFVNDDKQEIQLIQEKCQSLNVKAIETTVWEQGSKGGKELALEVTKLCNQDNQFTPLYHNIDIKESLKLLVTDIYGGKDVVFTKEAEMDYQMLLKYNWHKLPVCVAKTPVSLSDDPNKFGQPKDFNVTIRRLIPKLGSGFIVALAGDIMTMPGLPKQPAALNIDIDNNGKITGIF